MLIVLSANSSYSSASSIPWQVVVVESLRGQAPDQFIWHIWVERSRGIHLWIACHWQVDFALQVKLQPISSNVAFDSIGGEPSVLAVDFSLEIPPSSIPYHHRTGYDMEPSLALLNSCWLYKKIHPYFDRSWFWYYLVSSYTSHKKCLVRESVWSQITWVCVR